MCRRQTVNILVKRCLKMELPRRGERGRTKRRFMDVVREVMQKVGVTDEDGEDRER